MHFVRHKRSSGTFDPGRTNSVFFKITTTEIDIAGRARSKKRGRTMSDGKDRPANPETPWEFLSEDEQRRPMPPGAEDAAMHVIGFGTDGDDEDEDKVVVHYLEDEHPEIPDPSEPVEDTEHTANVQDLLIRQHYLPADEADTTS